MALDTLKSGKDRPKKRRRCTLDGLSDRELSITLCKKLDRAHKIQVRLLTRLDVIQNTILRVMDRVVKETE